MRNLLRIVVLALLSCALVGAAFAQEEPEEKPKTISVSPRVRLQAARTRSHARRTPDRGRL